MQGEHHTTNALDHVKVIPVQFLLMMAPSGICHSVLLARASGSKNRMHIGILRSRTAPFHFVAKCAMFKKASCLAQLTVWQSFPGWLPPSHSARIEGGGRSYREAEPIEHSHGQGPGREGAARGRALARFFRHKHAAALRQPLRVPAPLI